MKTMVVRTALAAVLVMAGVSLGLGIPGTRAHDEDRDRDKDKDDDRDKDKDKDRDDDKDKDKDNEAKFTYAVKVICEADGGITNVYTFLNVHNPNRKTVKFAKKGIALEDDQEPKRPGERQHDRLKPDYALQMGCQQIGDLGARGSTGFGDVIIESERQLDVWAVYISRNSDGTAADTDVVRVPPTKAND